MKKFSKDNLVGTPKNLLYSILIPETVIEDGAMIEVELKPERSKAVEKRKDELLGKPESEKQKHNSVTAMFCSMLAKEPDVDNFPKDNRDLPERAYEFFTTNNRDDLQNSFDTGIEKVLVQYLEVTEPSAFFLGFAGDNAGSDSAEPGDQPVD